MHDAKSVTGFVPSYESDKEKSHANDIHQKFVDTLKVVCPDLTIIDGLWAMQGDGPAVTRDWEIIRDSNTLFMSDDVVAVDSVATRAAGFDWDWVITTRLAEQQGFGHGKPEDIEVKGTALGKATIKFVPAGEWDIQGIWKNIDVYMHLACVQGCLPLLRYMLRFPEGDGCIGKLTQPLNFIIGNDTYIPPTLKPERTALIGDCVWYEGTYKFRQAEGGMTPKEMAERGALVVPGCPSVSNLFNMLFPWLYNWAAKDEAAAAGGSIAIQYLEEEKK
jgi:hypothetical protein